MLGAGFFLSSFDPSHGFILSRSTARELEIDVEVQDMSSYAHIIVAVSDQGVANITLNRPDKRNAFNSDMIAELHAAFETLAQDRAVRFVTIRGEGKSFSAGADLDWMKAAASYTQAENEADARALAEMLRALYEMPQPTLALVHGAAMGGGAGLVAACDLGVAMKDTKFKFSEVRLGLTPATISPFVIEAIGARWAKALFVTAEGFDAPYAEKMGLIQYTVTSDDELQMMSDYLRDLVLGAAPGAVADSKRLVQDVAGQPIDKALGEETAKRIAMRRSSDEGREGLSAFLEKRKPNWMV